MNYSDHPYIRQSTDEPTDASDNIEMSRHGAITAIIAGIAASVKKWWKGEKDKPHT